MNFDSAIWYLSDMDPVSSRFVAKARDDISELIVHVGITGEPFLEQIIPAYSNPGVKKAIGYIPGDYDSLNKLDWTICLKDGRDLVYPHVFQLYLQTLDKTERERILEDLNKFAGETRVLSIGKCPWCYKEPKTHLEEDTDEWVIQCPECGRKVSRNSRTAAIDAWNREKFDDNGWFGGDDNE